MVKRVEGIVAYPESNELISYHKGTHQGWASRPWDSGLHRLPLAGSLGCWEKLIPNPARLALTFHLDMELAQVNFQGPHYETHVLQGPQVDQSFASPTPYPEPRARAREAGPPPCIPASCGPAPAGSPGRRGFGYRC